MKANLRRRFAAITVVAAMLGLASSCSGPRIVPAPTPTPAPAPPPRPAPEPDVDWRDAPITPGEWEWGMVNGQSVARFAGGQLMLRCDPSSRQVTLLRGGAASGGVPMTIVTSATTRSVNTAPQQGSPPSIGVSFAGNDPILDALAFSRGRFAVRTSGMPTLYVPSWPEISRVVGDCR